MSSASCVRGSVSLHPARAATAVDADALSTAVNVMGVEKGLALVESLDGVEAIMITAGSEYKVVKSSGADAYLQ